METPITNAPTRRGRPRLHSDSEQAQRDRMKAADAASAALPVVPVLLVTIKQAAEILAVCTRTIETLVADGQLASITIRGSRRIALDELKRMAHTGTRYTATQQ